jgi:hypothetical protein
VPPFFKGKRILDKNRAKPNKLATFGVMILKSENYVYKITADKVAAVLSAIMLLFFGGVTFYLYRSGNGAFVFTAVFSGIILLITLLTLYRLLFYKLFIGKEGFYYRTSAFGGEYYEYALLKNAWKSEGINPHGNTLCYFSFMTPSGKVLRFNFMPQDEDAIDYLLERFNKTEKTEGFMEYEINEKSNGIAGILICLVIFLFFLTFEMNLLKNFSAFLLFLPGVVVPICLMFYLIIHYFFFRIIIKQDGFIFRTNPFNERFIEYKDIISSKEVRKVYRTRGVSGPNRRSYHYYFHFTERSGKKHKFIFQKPLHDYEISILKENIQKNKGHL